MHRHTIPYAANGQTVGLLGGSFDPAHAGHVHITLAAMKRFNLDHVWWLVSPGNPLKANGPAPIATRIRSAQELVNHPRIQITDIESQMGTRFTAQTLAGLIGLYPKVNFTWLMGEDNLAQFHLWQNWEWIAETVPIGIIARPGVGVPAQNSPFAVRYRHARIQAKMSRALAKKAAPAWCFVNTQLRPESSTELRESGQWPPKSRG